MKKRTAVLISGNGSNLQALLEAAAQPGFPAEISLVVSNKAEAYGLVRAKNAGVATEVLPHKDFASREAYDAALQQVLEAHRTELVCLAGFMRLLTSGFTTLWEGRMLNIHPSLLPAFKGLDTHARVLEAGVKFTGCTVHFVVPEMDAGPVVIQATVPVLPTDTPEALALRVHREEHRIYPAALAWLASGALRVADGRVQVAGGHYAEDSRLLNPLPDGPLPDGSHQTPN